jgi:hypothetical protein
MVRGRRATTTGVLIAGAATVALVVGLPGGAAIATPPAKAPRCTVLPADNPWNQRVDAAPVASTSATLIGAMQPGNGFHADFGSGTYDGGPIGIPLTVVGKDQKRVPVRFEYADESDRGRYPVPRTAKVEGGAKADGDRHVLVLDRDRCRLYELYDAHPVAGGRSWRAGSGAIFDLRSNRLRPAGWTSADAAGLPILPGLARYEEVRRGVIDHALRFTMPRTRRSYVYPARHQAGSSDDASLPPMGLRVRLKAGTSLAGLGPQARVIATALKQYGGMLADNGSAWYFSGAPDARWDNDDLHTLDRLKGSDFEVVDTAKLPRPGA